MALLELAARWRDEAGQGAGRPPVFAATVDHRLRAESRDEARMVADFAKARGVSHRILDWTDEKPATRLQERARAARYSLLKDEARRVGADFILTAHHADDQAETILMRLVRGSSVAGLAGMAALSLRDEITLFRPFLGLRKASLVAFCEAAEIPFIRDPSNENPRFGRTGARRLAAMLEAEGLGPGEWARLARRAARAEAALASAASSALASLPAAPDGSLAMSAFAQLPDEIALRCLAARVCAAGGGETLRLERLEAAWERISDAYKTRKALGLTLAGAKIRLDRRGRVHFSREEPRRRGRSAAKMMESVHANEGKTGGPAATREVV
jgi:tRNA(Ile)-lysidine synthase